ncbi:MAG: hypothetical protein DRI89_13190 [Bacteroidetes bacterium]|nr:MAG: hypothetical protein DRI89_13190 [Bacteroidota bacterium]
MRDASKVIGVVNKLLSEKEKQPFVEEIEEQYEKLRVKNLTNKKQKDYISLSDARKNKFSPEWKTDNIRKPDSTGVKYLMDFDLTAIRKYIDWTFFFHAWKLNGKYPSILKDPIKGEEAQKLFDDAQKMLDEIITKKWLTANAAFGIFPAQADGDDVELSDGTRFHFLRNQEQKPVNIPNLCLADFIAPKSSGLTDYIGTFAVTTGIGIENQIKQFEANDDDYSAIMLKVLADRLAEAFAELLHKKVRKDFWGYAASEQLELTEVLREKYKGIRPAPGYPACPEHSEKATLFSLLNAENKIGVKLTENYAMYPAASVSGFYFAHPDAQYFQVGKLLPDQVEDYAKRKKLNVEKIEKLLPMNLV